MELPDHLRHRLTYLKQHDPEQVVPLLEYVCEMWAQEFKSLCAQQMAVVPRNPELASDYAAQAAVYDRFVKDLLSL